jgi:hypothetical protein
MSLRLVAFSVLFDKFPPFLRSFVEINELETAIQSTQFHVGYVERKKQSRMRVPPVPGATIPFGRPDNTLELICIKENWICSLFFPGETWRRQLSPRLEKLCGVQIVPKNEQPPRSDALSLHSTGTELGLCQRAKLHKFDGNSEMQDRYRTKEMQKVEMTGSSPSPDALELLTDICIPYSER